MRCGDFFYLPASLALVSLSLVLLPPSLWSVDHNEGSPLFLFFFFRIFPHRLFFSVEVITTSQWSLLVGIDVLCCSKRSLAIWHVL